ncbi:hypothetical protein GCM10027590_64370 [Nocardiopsis nanhaiensis]
MPPCVVGGAGRANATPYPGLPPIGGDHTDPPFSLENLSGEGIEALCRDFLRTLVPVGAQLTRAGGDSLDEWRA